MFNLFGFKKFVEGPQIDYLSALGDEGGIEWSDIVKVLENEPWVSSHFELGNFGIKYKLSPWEIVKNTLTPKGADIRLKPQARSRSYLSGNMLNKSGHSDDNRYHLNRDELIKFLTTGWTPAVQPNMDSDSLLPS